MRFVNRMLGLAFLMISVNGYANGIEQQTNLQVADSVLVVPKAITVGQTLTKENADKIIQAARLFYTFWNTGDKKYLDMGVSKGFIDNTLPEGRPQGVEGLLFASKNFRTAVPDLSCTVEDLLVANNKVTARLSFTGTFKGKFKNIEPTGKPVKFMAIDILHIEDGKLVEDWHLEDNLTLMLQLDAVKM